MTLRFATKTLLILALGLPVIQCVLIWVRGLVAAMGDEAGAAFTGHVGTVCLAAWSVSLVGLVIVLAINSLNESPPSD